jgi:uroporphyrinogen-III synthase
MTSSCLLITRPPEEGRELARLVGDLDLRCVLLPAHEFAAVEPARDELEDLNRAAASGQPPLLIFTSTRAVEFGLPQLGIDLIRLCRLAAIGPATAAALQQAGLDQVLQPKGGYTSEDLLHSIANLGGTEVYQAWILAAAGGRKRLLAGLQEMGIKSRMLLVYDRRAAGLPEDQVRQLQSCDRIISVWTSADAMNLLSTRLAPETWKAVCAGDWLLTSQRLADIASPFHPAGVHFSSGPDNPALAAAIRRICA